MRYFPTLAALLIAGFLSTVLRAQQFISTTVTYVSEDWWSRDLQLFLLSKQVDPVGTTTVRTLTNIRTSEPDAQLFAVPADYKIVDETGRFDVKVIVPGQNH